MLFTALAYAQDAAQGAPKGQDMTSFLMMMGMIFAIFYFLVIRPQSKKKKEHEAKLSALKEKDKVITAGGIIGIISRVKGNIVELKVADNVKIDMLKSSISSTLEDEN